MTTIPLEKIRLEDYREPDWLLDDVHLTIRLDPAKTRVISRLSFRPRTDTPPSTLWLDGENLTLVSAKVDGKSVDPQVKGNGLRIPVPNRAFVWEAEVEIAPEANTALEGLYISGGIYCTQCEAEGFRRITYYPDRPDVMAPFTVRIEGDAPVLLSNGNLISEGDGWAEWHDPWPKPSYLFALVAGDLRATSGTFRTVEGREVILNVWVRPGDEDRCDYALDSLIRAMKWDEEVYGRAYDLDVFNLVAVDDFNAGAMENKGLNIFNSKYVLASPESATDGDYEGIESVVAHEYFHNWTGNRITCRDWFQLCLKEGLTVYRDQEFTSEMRSRAVKRIADVMLLRAAQFREDQGPLAHPPRPDSYSEINNFYTVTVYEKGAEIVRMLHTILGPDRFVAGLTLYFERHDGDAATVEDFFACFQEVAGGDLEGFDIWWTQAGTPRVNVERHWDGTVLTLDITQHIPPTPGEDTKRPVPIPLAVGMLTPEGSDLGQTDVLVVRSASERWQFDTLKSAWCQSDNATALPPAVEAPAPTPSLNRGFSAPVILDAGSDSAEALHLLAYDTDPFNRWDAGRRLIKEAFAALVLNGQKPDDRTLDAFGNVLTDETLDPAFKALALRLPSDDDMAGSLADGGATPDPKAIHLARGILRNSIALRHRETLSDLFEHLTSDGGYRPDAAGSARRSLRMIALSFLTLIDGPDRARMLFESADNMTERLAALANLIEAGDARSALRVFFDEWQGKPGVLDKWFALQIGYADPEDALAVARRLTTHTAFDWKVPNRVRSVVGSLARHHAGFHFQGGEGYQTLAGWIRKLDPINPQIAAALTGAFQSWKRYDGDRQGQMQDALSFIAASDGLSRDTAEMVTRLKQG